MVLELQFKIKEMILSLVDEKKKYRQNNIRFSSKYY